MPWHLGKPQGKKAGLLWIFAEGGGRVKPESKAFEELLKESFFSLSLDIFKERGEGEPHPNLMKNFFQLKFGHFPSKGGGLTQIQTC